MIELNTVLICYVSGLLGTIGGFSMGRFDARVEPLGYAAIILICVWPILIMAILLGILVRFLKNLTRKMLLCMKSLKS